MKNVSLKILSGLGIVMLMLTTMMTPANAGKISDTKDWKGHGEAYTSLYADVQRSCGTWTCTSWVTTVRHYSRDFGSTHSTVVGKHQWGGTSITSATAGYKTGSITVSATSKGCTITVGEHKDDRATFEGGGRVCGAKSNVVVYHDYSSSTGRHRVGSNVKSWTVRAS